MSGERVNSKIIIFILVAIAVIFISIWLKKPGEKEFFSKKILKPAQSISIFVVGDMMLDRNVRNMIDKNGFDTYFSGIKNIVNNADIAVANLEGPFTDFPSVTASLKSKELKFTFDPTLAPALADLGFDVLGLANNHTLNFGYSGFESTKKYISSAGMLYYGDPENQTELSVVVTKKGIKIGFVGFHEFSYKNIDKVFFEIARLKKEVDFLIVSPHWGVEYQKQPTTKMIQWAHDFIDYGADTVIGAHPHVIGIIEEYKGKRIYYSLGNFAFDQYFSEETMNGLGVMIYLKNDDDVISTKFNDIFIRSDKKGTAVSDKKIP